MPFDGLDHRPALIPPYAYHPQAPATPDCLSAVQRSAFSFARSQGCMVGWQTYNIHLARARTFIDAAYFAQNDWVDIAQFRRLVSPNANYAWFEAHFRLTSGRPVDVHHRIVVSDGADTATATVTTRIEPYVTREDDKVTVTGDIAVLDRQIVRGSVLLTGQNLDDVIRTFTVSAYAVGLDIVPVAENYQPEMIVAWVETSG